MQDAGPQATLMHLDHTARVLVVDDNEDDCTIIQRFIHKEYALEKAASGSEAIEHIREEPPDVVLLDYKLPDTNGLELLRRIRHELPGVAIVLMTGMGVEELAVEAMKHGAHDYLTKEGLSPAALDLVLKSALRRSRAEILRHSEEELWRKTARELSEILVGENDGHEGLAVLTDRIGRSSAIPAETREDLRTIQEQLYRILDLVETLPEAGAADA